MTATPLVPWVVCKDSGEILVAHCTCMAGYVTHCTHVGFVSDIYALMQAWEGMLSHCCYNYMLGESI